MAAFSGHDECPAVDICSFLCGAWKRNLEWRHFGGAFQPIHATNTVVVINSAEDAETADESKFLDWSFTLKQSVDEERLVFGYRMKLIPDQNGTYMEWMHQGCRCHGSYRPSSSLISLNFLMKGATISVSYFMQSPDNMAVCVVETSSSKMATIQYGNMVRIRHENYKNHPFLKSLIAPKSGDVSETFKVDEKESTEGEGDN